jgi:hypothetical protein
MSWEEGDDHLANPFQYVIRYLGDGVTPATSVDLESSKHNVLILKPTDADIEKGELVDSLTVERDVYVPIGNDVDAEDGTQANAYIPIIQTMSGRWAAIHMIDDGTSQEEILSTAVGTVLLRDSPTSQTVEVYNPYATTIPINVSVTIGLNSRTGQWIILGADCAT